MWTRRAVLKTAGALAAVSLWPIGRGFAATDQLNLALLTEPSHLDPTAPGANAATMDAAYLNIFEGLTSFR